MAASQLQHSQVSGRGRAASARLAGVLVALESKPPHRTYWVAVEAPAGREPEELYAALRGIGFDTGGAGAPPPPVDGVQQRTFTKPGSGLFRSWVDEEREANLGDVRRVLAAFGFGEAPLLDLTARDLL